MIVYTGMTVEQIRRISEDILREVHMLKIPHECSRCSNTYPSAKESLQGIPMENKQRVGFHFQSG